MEIIIPYKPRDWQGKVHRLRKRWNVLVCHRRAGKTNLALSELLKCAITTKESRWAYIAPTYKQAKTIAWDILKHYSRVIPGVTFNESELRADFPNGARITLYGADNPDSLRGIALWGVVFDEYSQQPSNIFSEIIRPALSDHQGWAIWIGTPKGQNSFWELYEYAKSQEDWFTLILKASESGIISADELEDAKRTMTSDEYEQEYECSFTAAIKGAIYAAELSELHTSGRIKKSIWDKTLPVYTFWDIGISDYTSIVFTQFSGSEVRIIDFLQDSGKALDFYSTELKKKPYTYEKHYFPHDIQARSLVTGASLLETAEKLFEKNKCAITERLGVLDGINAVRINFYKFFFDEDNTRELRNCLSNYRNEWDDKKGMYKDSPLHDWSSHAADAFRYMAINYQKLTKSTVLNQGSKTFFNRKTGKMETTKNPYENHAGNAYPGHFRRADGVLPVLPS